MRSRAASCATLLALAGIAARADEKPHRAPGHERRDTSDAATHAERGLELIAQGEFERAIVELSAAEAQQAAPGNVQHIAECQEALGRIPEAIASYRRYLAAAGDAPGVEPLKRHADDLEVAIHATPARELLDNGEFEKALHELEAAEKVRHEARRRYDMAICYEGLNDPIHALESYRAYLKEAPDAADAGEIDGRVKVLSGERMAPPPPSISSPPPDPFAAPAPPAAKWYESRGGWGLTVGALILVSGSATLAGLSRSAAGEADRAHSEADFNSADDRGRNLNWAAVGVGVASAVLWLAAIALFAHHGRDAPIAATATTPTLGAAGARK